MAQPNPKKTVHTSTRGGLYDSVLGTRNLMICAALGVVLTIIGAPITFIEIGISATPKMLFVGAGLMGAWSFLYLLAPVIVRRPGSSLVTSIVTGIITMLITPYGPSALVGFPLGAILIELTLLPPRRHRQINLRSTLLSGIIFGAIWGIMYVAIMYKLGWLILLGGLILSIISAIIGAWLAWLLGSVVARAGITQRK